jgi:hypothetical protein
MELKDKTALLKQPLLEVPVLHVGLLVLMGLIICLVGLIICLVGLIICLVGVIMCLVGLAVGPVGLIQSMYRILEFF